MSWNRGNLLIIAFVILILYVLLSLKDGMSHWLWLVGGATYAAFALWRYLDRPRVRALVIAYSLWSVFSLARFYADYFPRKSSVPFILACAGFAAAIAGTVFMFAGTRELRGK
jgi:hypothetical protein